MKSYKQLISEVAQPKAGDEIEFVAKHIVNLLDHPASEDEQHAGAVVKKKGAKRIADYDTGEDMSVYESEVDENAFIMAASDAKVKGKKNFKFDGKDYPVKIKDDVAKKVVGEDFDVSELDEETFDYFIESASIDQLNEIIGKLAGSVVRGAAKAVAAGAKRLTVAGRADAAEKRANAMEKKRKDMERLKKARERIAKLQSSGNKNPEQMKKAKEALAKKQKKMNEELTDAQKKKREEIVLAMKKDKKSLVDRYGDDWESVMYATATKQAKNESLEESNISDNVKLKDGSSVKVSKDEQKILNALYKNLKGSNKSKMEETMLRDKKGFQEILRFAKEVYEE
jgi:hypothetical protein